MKTKELKTSQKPTPQVELPVSLRDYFAMSAMNAMIIGNKTQDCTYTVGKQGAIGVAHDAYNIADAMLKNRKED